MVDTSVLAVLQYFSLVIVLVSSDFGRRIGVGRNTIRSYFTLWVHLSSFAKMSKMAYSYLFKYIIIGDTGEYFT